jgi:hypothetical protein
MGLRSGSRTALILAMAAAVSAGCQVSKSANPLAPTVAGPIAGVTITTPNLLEPGQDWQIRLRDQPVRLMIQNADTSGVRTLTYTFEVAADSGFSSIVFKRTGVAAGAGITTLQLPDALATGRTYWWRARAEDGANVGDYSKVVSFIAVAPVELGPPAAAAPSGVILTTEPEFKINAGTKAGPSERIVHYLQVSNDPAFASIAWTFVIDDAGSQTTVAQNYSFLNNHTYYWRVQTKDLGDSQAASAWSSVQVFTTAEPAPPPPIGGGGGGGPFGNGDWQSCGSTAGEAIVRCVHAAIQPHDEYGAFEVVKRVAWLLRGDGAGLMIKNGGENVVSWRGYSFGASRMMYRGGHYFKIITDVGPGGANGPSWQDAGQGDPTQYVPAMDPSLP